MAMEFTNGPTTENMKASTATIKSMVSVSITGQMERYTKDIGLTANSMTWVL